MYTFQEKLRMLRDGKKLTFKTADGRLFAVGQKQKFGVYWTTIYTVDIIGVALGPVKGYKNKLIDLSTLKDWFGHLIFMGVIERD